MTRKMILAGLAATLALPASAQSGFSPASGEQSAQDVQAFWAEHDKYASAPGYEAPAQMQKEVQSYNKTYQSLLPPENAMRYHPLPHVDYGGPTVSGTVAAANREIAGARAGIAAFESEVRAMSAKARRVDGDAPNRYLVAQGWKIVKSLGDAFNDDVVPAANSVYESSTKGNQDLEILIEIAGGNGGQQKGATQGRLFNGSLPDATQLAGTESELQLVNEVQRQHDGAVAEREKAAGPLQRARAKLPAVAKLIYDFDAAYSQYNRGLSHLQSKGAQVLDHAAAQLAKAIKTSQKASELLASAHKDEQKAINDVRICTEANIKALQNPSDPAAQTDARGRNREAIQSVEKYNQKVAMVNKAIGQPVKPDALKNQQGTITEAKYVQFRHSGKVSSAAARKAKTGSADSELSAERGPGAAGQRP